MPQALITGAGRRRGIAADVAIALASDGWDLALNYWQPADAAKGLPGGPDDPELIARAARESGRTVVLVPGDLELPDTAARVTAAARAELGSDLDALVLCHTYQHNSTILSTTVASFDRHYAVNVRSTWLLLAEFIRQLPGSGGSVVALTSDHTVGNLPYGVTKGALDRLVLAAAHELEHPAVRANVINPGPVDTGWMSEELRESCLAENPSGRVGTPADTANLIRFLVSERGEWVNGQLLYSDGGWPKGRLRL